MKRDEVIAYNERRKDIGEQLAALKQSLIAHGKQFRKSGNWGYVGDLGYVSERLKELNKFMAIP